MVDVLKLDLQTARARLKTNLRLLNEAASRIPRKAPIHKRWKVIYGVMLFLMTGMVFWTSLMVYVADLWRVISQSLGF